MAYQIGKKWIWLGTFLLSLIVGSTRLYLGVHYPHDIIAGWICGALSLLSYHYISKFPTSRLIHALSAIGMIITTSQMDWKLIELQPGLWYAPTALVTYIFCEAYGCRNLIVAYDDSSAKQVFTRGIFGIPPVLLAFYFMQAKGSMLIVKILSAAFINLWIALAAPLFFHYIKWTRPNSNSAKIKEN